VSSLSRRRRREHRNQQELRQLHQGEEQQRQQGEEQLHRGEKSSSTRVRNSSAIRVRSSSRDSNCWVEEMEENSTMVYISVFAIIIVIV